MKPPNILIVDDEFKIVEAVTSYLESNGLHVLQAGDCAEARRILASNPVDLMILDLMLPDMSGEAFCTEIRKTSRIPILMLTAKATEADMLTGLGIGADDYMTKPFSIRELLARVQALLRRSVATAKDSHRMSFHDGDLVIEMESHTVWKCNVPVNLTPNEYKLLVILAARPNRVFSREALISSAFGHDYEGSDRTIDSHIKNLRQKIEPDSRNPRYILTLHGVGYKFGGV